MDIYGFGIMKAGSAISIFFRVVLPRGPVGLCTCVQGHLGHKRDVLAVLE